MAAGACSSLSGVLNLTLGLKREPPLVRTMSAVRESIGAGLTAGSGSALCSHLVWTRARLNQGRPRLGQGMAGAGLAVAGCGNGGTGAGQEQEAQLLGLTVAVAQDRHWFGSGRQCWSRARLLVAHG